MHLIAIPLVVLLMSSCSALKDSEYLTSFIKEKTSMPLPPPKSIEMSGDKNTIKIENRAVVPYFEVIFYNKNHPVYTQVGAEKEIIKSKILKL